MGLSADTGKAVTVNYALEAPTLRDADNVHECDVLGEDVSHSELVTELRLPGEVRLELDELAHRSDTCLFEMPHQRRAGVLFSRFVIGKLYSGIAVFFYCTELRNNARASLDNGAWHVLAISTENGSHSDFLSNQSRHWLFN